MPFHPGPSAQRQVDIINFIILLREKKADILLITERSYPWAGLLYFITFPPKCFFNMSTHVENNRYDVLIQIK